jgi:hypothetical protein
MIPLSGIKKSSKQTKNDLKHYFGFHCFFIFKFFNVKNGLKAFQKQSLPKNHKGLEGMRWLGMRTARFKLTTLPSFLSQKVVLNVTQKEENKIFLSNKKVNH